MRLQNKIAAVTGASKGLGKAIALEIAKEGADVALSARHKPDLEAVAEEIRSLGRRAITVACDVSLSPDVQNMLQQVVKNFGGVDILVNNAGVSTVANVVDMTEEEWDLNMDVNAKGTFLCSKYFARQMIQQGRGGKIINIASRAARVGVVGLAHYSASKFAVLGFTQALAIELAPNFINVNAICPGRIETEMTIKEVLEYARKSGTGYEESKREYFGPIPWGRPGKSEDVAYAAVFLASPESDYLTGTSINVMGGLDVVRGGHT